MWAVSGLLLPAFFAMSGCGSGRTVGVGPTATGVSLARDVQPVFTEFCGVSGCHAGAAPEQGMDLSDARRAFDSIVNVDSNQVELKRVLPRDSANSYLYQKISQEFPPVGDRMPRGGLLSATNIELIRQWIDGGAMP